MISMRFGVAAFFLLLLSACEFLGFKEEKDSGPKRPLDVSHILEPVPRVEVRTIAGNVTPYTVLGKTYHLMENPDGFRERGIASWYGNKFHGRPTSNGEIYDMYAMTAAHKTLPIPSYVRVTNLDNRRSVIVRVNDRGPFHEGRIIDLSYAAAKKLAIASVGTAKVSVEYIDPLTYSAAPVSGAKPVVPSGEPKAPAPAIAGGYALPDHTYLQVGAFSQETSAKALQKRIAPLTKYAVLILSPKRKSPLYRVHVGPFSNNLELMQLRQKLLDQNFPSPHVVYP